MLEFPGESTGMSSSNSAVCLPAPALRPFITQYAGFLAFGLPPGMEVGLPFLQDYELAGRDNGFESEVAYLR